MDLTPDGSFLVFVSSTDHLTPDDTSTAPQVFEYDAQTGALVRVSIGQDGYNDNGNTDCHRQLDGIGTPIAFNTKRGTRLRPREILECA